jgi:hypothetical protein
VFAVAGAAHVALLGPALAALRRVSRHGILVVQRAGDPPAAHAACLPVETPPSLTAHQAAIWLKTRLHRLVGLVQPFCYLDSDVIALTPEIDEVFTAVTAPVAFAPDHATLDEFSYHAVKCGCERPCGHLREALFCDFGADIPGDFRLWNGGVFTARAGAEAFLDDWHALATALFTRPYWFTRDQAALAAATWRAGWQGAPTLPERFNTIIDCYDGLFLHQRAAMPARRLAVMPRHLPLPDAVAAHLINGGVGRAGWPHWDNISALLETPA